MRELQNRPLENSRDIETGGGIASVNVSNVLSEEKKKQVIALGQLGWSLRRIQKAIGVRRETAGSYLKAAGVEVFTEGIRPCCLWLMHFEVATIKDFRDLPLLVPALPKAGDRGQRRRSLRLLELLRQFWRRHKRRTNGSPISATRDHLESARR
jgi:hypothetical protein